MMMLIFNQQLEQTRWEARELHENRWRRARMKFMKYSLWWFANVVVRFQGKWIWDEWWALLLLYKSPRLISQLFKEATSNKTLANKLSILWLPSRHQKKTKLICNFLFFILIASSKRTLSVGVLYSGIFLKCFVRLFKIQPPAVGRQLDLKGNANGKRR